MKLTLCSLSPLFDYYQHDRPVNWNDVFQREAPLIVEVGFGMGEVLMRKAQAHPDQNFVGIEVNWERIFKTMKSISRWNEDSQEQSKINNIRIIRLDAWITLERLFDGRSIDHMYSLFPCPWPKKSHIKHRLFSESFLKLVNSRLKDGASLQVVTDYYPYFQWIEEQNDPAYFSVQSDGIKPQFGTKFERKWLEEGQEEFFELNFVKNANADYPVKKDCELKSYRLKGFNPDKFSFEPIKGEVSIILKDKIFDPVLNQMLIRVIVGEQHLTQNLWIMVRQDREFWRLCKMEGQHFFPTPGINAAIEAVYQAACAETA